jgi:hypothetical protein
MLGGLKGGEYPSVELGRRICRSPAVATMNRYVPAEVSIEAFGGFRSREDRS